MLSFSELFFASLAACFIVCAITSPYRGRTAEFARPILRIRNCRRPASSAHRGKVPRVRAIAGELFVLVPRPGGNKIAREEADSSAIARARAQEGKCSFASRSRVREILPSPRFLLTASAVVARSCSDRISKGNYVSIASIVVNRGARPNMGLLATTIATTTTSTTSTISSVHHHRSERRGTATGAKTARKRLSEEKDARGKGKRVL